MNIVSLSIEMLFFLFHVASLVSFCKLAIKSRCTVSRKGHWAQRDQQGAPPHMQQQKLPGRNKIQILEYSSSLSFGKCCQFFLDCPSFKTCNRYLSGAGFCSCSGSVLFEVHCVSFTLKIGPSTCKPKAIFHAAISFSFFSFFYLNSWLCCLHIASNPEGHAVSYIKRKKRQNIYNGYLEAK